MAKIEVSLNFTEAAEDQSGDTTPFSVSMETLNGGGFTELTWEEFSALYDDFQQALDAYDTRRG